MTIRWRSLTFDEGQFTDTRHVGGRIATILADPRLKLGYRSAALYQHENTLATILKALGITQGANFLGYLKYSNKPMMDMFQ